MKTRGHWGKRLVAVLTVLALALGMVSFAAAEETVLYESDFSKDVDGWFTYDPNTLYVKNKALGIKGRTESWNGPRREFPLVAGTTYHISVEVCQKQEASAILMISVAHSKNGKTTYENIISGEVQKGKWVTLEENWTAGAFDDYILYVETIDSPTLSYEIRNFRVVTGYSYANRMLTEYNSSIKKIKPFMDALKQVPYPDFMMTPVTDITEWIPPLEQHELAAIQEVTLEDKVLSVTMDRKVSNISVIETTPRWDNPVVYSSDEDKSNKNRDVNGTVKLSNPAKDEVEVYISESVKVEKKEYYYRRKYILDPSGPFLKLDYIDESCSGDKTDYPPYDKIKKPQIDLNVTCRADGSISSFNYGFGNGQGYLSVTVDLDENNRMEGGTVYKSSLSFKGRYDLEIRMNGDHMVNYVTMSPAEDLGFTAVVMKQDELSYYRQYIRETYPGVNLSKPDFDVWTYYFDFGKGATMRYFLTRDPLFTVDENGVLHMNEEARDINGNPFPEAAIQEIMDPEIFTFPLV